jgi:hypothetical protein
MPPVSLKKRLDKKENDLRKLPNPFASPERTAWLVCLQPSSRGRPGDAATARAPDAGMPRGEIPPSFTCRIRHPELLPSIALENSPSIPRR